MDVEGNLPKSHSAEGKQIMLSATFVRNEIGKPLCFVPQSSGTFRVNIKFCVGVWAKALNCKLLASRGRNAGVLTGRLHILKLKACIFSSKFCYCRLATTVPLP